MARSTSRHWNRCPAASSGRVTAPPRAPRCVIDHQPGRGQLVSGVSREHERHTLLSRDRACSRRRALEERRHRRRHGPGARHQPGSGERCTPRSHAASTGHCIFSANDGVTGQELWKSDGTDAGTVLVKDINPGSRQLRAHGPHERQRDALLQRVRRCQRRRAVEERRHRRRHRPGQGHQPGRLLLYTERPDERQRHAVLPCQRLPRTGSSCGRATAPPAGTVLVKDIFPARAAPSPAA